MERVVANAVGAARKTTFIGREFYVVPMTLVVPGVLNGSRGAYYYPPSELAKDPTIWNGMPLVVYHPQENGQSVSARQPEVYEKSCVGYVFRANFSPPRGKNDVGRLVAEGWFDSERARRVDKRVYDALKAGMVMELSTGLFAEAQPAPPGSVDNRGRPYEYVARNYRGDHVAVLPDQTGACSVADGCGVMVNSGAAVAPLPGWFWAACRRPVAGWRDVPDQP